MITFLAAQMHIWDDYVSAYLPHMKIYVMIKINNYLEFDCQSEIIFLYTRKLLNILWDFKNLPSISLAINYNQSKTPNNKKISKFVKTSGIKKVINVKLLSDFKTFFVEVIFIQKLFFVELILNKYGWIVYCSLKRTNPKVA